ncbi:hypothetical protein U1872_05775 [Sphingomonas sp. RB3P16]|uniref:hypothetical protein n=1 Tax=Parasphingomonas frigoris TaxID=3096163 RepID=UPI002FC6F081
MLRTLAVAITLAAVPVAGFAQTAPAAGPETRQAESGKPPLRIRSITLTGNQTCPKPTDPDAEIVVCAKQGEPYRIPKELRDDKPIPAQNQSWVNRAAVADEVGRRAAGLPDTCSPTGSGGQTGCAMMRAQQYAAEKAEAKRQAAAIP